jgi:hypothetical protein
MADSEDPAVEAIHETRAHGAIHSTSRISQLTRQLADRNDPMLPLCEIGE